MENQKEKKENNSNRIIYSLFLNKLMKKLMTKLYKVDKVKAKARASGCWLTSNSLYQEYKNVPFF